MKSPKVTVVVTCYDLGRHIEEAVNSVLAQTMSDYEIIIVNDGSTDEYTNRLLANFRKPKTTVYTIENRGPSGARNYGIARARAPYILPLDADDILEATCLEKASLVLEENPVVAIVSFWYRAFGADEFEYTPDSCTLENILAENRLCGNSMFRKSVWEDVGGYDEDFREGYEDWEFWIRVLAKGYKAHIIKECLFRYRVRGGSRDRIGALPKNRRRIIRKIIKKHEALFAKHLCGLLLRKDEVYARAEGYQAEMREALEWYKDGRNEHERYIAELTDIIEKLERQSRELNRALLDTKRKDNEMIDKQRHLLDLKNDELNFIYLSKQWKIATALKEARHSLIALIKLPFRVIRLFF